jgi:hypothetical protein
MPTTKQAHAVICGIAQEVESVGLQRCRTGGHACTDLDGEHPSVDR